MTDNSDTVDKFENNGMSLRSYNVRGVSHEMELSSGFDLNDMKRLSCALEAQSELDGSNPLARFSQRFSAAKFVLDRLSSSLVFTDDPDETLARLALFARFQNAIYGGMRLNNMGLTVTAYSCLREAQEVFDLLQLVSADSQFSKVVIEREELTTPEIIDYLVPFENEGLEYAKRRHRIKSLAAPTGPDIPQTHFELTGNDVTLDVGGRRIESAQDDFMEIALGLFDDCIFVFSGERFESLEKMRRQMMVNIYSGRSFAARLKK